MGKYVYDGPIKVFDRCVAEVWHAETIAESEAKAKSNISYQYKKSHNMIQGTKISLPGRLREV